MKRDVDRADVRRFDSLSETTLQYSNEVKKAGMLS